ncbi:DUF817 domain-containing protein [Asticcacaulis sp. BYS171W]|uniref:DUF817 domain-containing protein n=1 Tax=Asticcacaulis aquaticus TaxID=2984212 RepID=A0ABT5HTV9_9CAUL|nr:DUF817 domain-containing protein [Asticcacaulis aquaticus]MDC7683508.1 DUF817 domain-containing protein [Asticcacaulis aquaticus]
MQAPRRFIHRALSHLPAPLAEFILFGLKMAWSCLFGAAMLALLIVTHLFWPADAPLYRYDFLFAAAVTIQILMLLTRLESLEEARVIFLYHVVGTAMEIFKTHMGSWTYPEAALIRLGEVPLFTGFMYACVGSFIARASRVMDLRYTHYPPLWATVGLAILIYVNFFTHHYVVDIRYLLFAGIGGLFWRTWIVFRVDKVDRKMPFLLANFLTAFFLWVSENIGTLTKTWTYPGQETWHLVSLHKLGAWALLLVLSFVMVSLVIRPKAP